MSDSSDGKLTFSSAVSAVMGRYRKISASLVVMSGRIKRLEKYDSSVMKILGLVSTVLGTILLIMSLYAAVAKEDYWLFLAPAPFFLLPGLYAFLRFRFSQISASIGILLITETWVLCFIAGIIPFYGSGMVLIDAIYEGISGFTTTGSSMLKDFDSTPNSILLWRAVIQWFGGMTVVFVFAFLLPMIGMGGKNLGSNEFGGNSSEFSQDIRTSAISFVRMYALLTVIEIFLLLFIGLIGVDSDNLSLFDCICISFSNVSTGGLLPFSDSMASFSFPVQFVTWVFMILGASNFFLMVRSIAQRKNLLIRSREWIVMMVWFLVCALVITVALIYNTPEQTGLYDFWQALYAVSSAGTSAGFAIADYLTWPAVATVILLIAQFVGGCSGSTAGGIKVHRLMAMKAYIFAGMEKIMHPGAVTIMQVDGSRMDSDQITSVLSTALLFMATLIIGTIAIMVIEDSDMLNSLYLTVSAVSNAGAVVGTGSLSFEPTELSKIILCFMMYLGRMELVYVLMVFTRRFWSEVMQSSKKRSHRFILFAGKN